MTPWRDLLTQAERLAHLDPRRPRQVNLRRAISSAYYSVFHFLIDAATRAIAGGASNRQQVRAVLARTFSHGSMARACKAFMGPSPPDVFVRAVGTGVPPDVRALSRLFVDLQEERHQADYDMLIIFPKAQVIARIAQVHTVPHAWKGVRKSPEARFFLFCLVLRPHFRS